MLFFCDLQLHRLLFIVPVPFDFLVCSLYLLAFLRDIFPPSEKEEEEIRELV